MTSRPHVAMAERRLGLPDWITSLRRHVVASTVIAKLKQLIDAWGIFTVALVRRVGG